MQFCGSISVSPLPTFQWTEWTTDKWTELSKNWPLFVANYNETQFSE